MESCKLYKYIRVHSWSTGTLELSTVLCPELPHDFSSYKLEVKVYTYKRGHGGRVVTLSPPTSEAGVRFLARPQVGKLVVARQFTVQNPNELYVLVSSALLTTRRDMTYTVLKAT